MKAHNLERRRARAGMRVLAVLVVLAGLACDTGAPVVASPPPADARASVVALAGALKPWQKGLLDQAFSAASAMPTVPHKKNRARAQDLVVQACFKVEQPGLALGFIEKIDNWRRGIGYADLAAYCAEHGNAAAVPQYVALADAIANDQLRDDTNQDWPRDRIRLRIARTYALLGDAKRSAQYAAGTTDTEGGRLNDVRQQRLPADAFDDEVKALDALVATGGFDQTRAALEACCQLHTRFYADATRRKLLQGKVPGYSARVPLQVRIDVLSQMARNALSHADQANALELVNAAQAALTSAPWLPEDEIVATAKLASLRHQAGDEKAARQASDDAQTRYGQSKDKITDIVRAGTLRPIAEAYQTMGDRGAALAVYKRAIEAGMMNPNARPRADDFVAACCSLVVNGAEPDAQLAERLAQVRAALKEPW